MLVVDDDESVLQVSRMVLSRMEVMGRPLNLFMARSGEEARTLCQTHEFAAAIVDVVMETDGAGLDFISWLRTQPRGRATRIVVRTGQPGLAPEEHVLRDFEINDYWLKTELSARRIRTIITGLIRSYRDLIVVEQQRQDVTEILRLLPTLFRKRDPSAMIESLGVAARHLYGNPNTSLMLLHFEPDGLEHGRLIASTTERVPPGGVPVAQKLTPQELELLRASADAESFACREDEIALLIRHETGHGEALLGRNWPRIEDHRHALGNLLASNALLIRESHLLLAQQQERLEAQLQLDELTGLYNRRGLVTQLGLPRDPLHAGYLILFQLENLDAVNEAYGQSVGDQLLLAVSQRLRDMYGTLVVARLDGGTFGLYFDAQTSYPDHVLARLQQLFEPLMVVGELHLPARIHLGLAHREGSSPFELMHQAGMALKVARRHREPRFALYDPALAAIDVRNAQLQTYLQHIELEDELLVVFQPIVSLYSGKIVGAESLVRWNSRQFGLVSPLEFIPLAERSGLITHLTYIVLRKALEALDQWRTLDPSLYVTVNISPTSLREEGFVDGIVTLLGARPPEQLWLEMTESEQLVQEAHCLQRMQALKSRGIRFMIDDFGTGYSSLSYLNRLPVDALKLDRSFVSPLDQSDAAHHQDLLEAIMNVADALHLSITAEGVETREQADSLKNLRYRLAQGYLFSKPISAELFGELLQAEL